LAPARAEARPGRRIGPTGGLIWALGERRTGTRRVEPQSPVRAAESHPAEQGAVPVHPLTIHAQHPRKRPRVNHPSGRPAAFARVEQRNNPLRDPLDIRLAEAH
jgi:hypothetical protein